MPVTDPIPPAGSPHEVNHRPTRLTRTDAVAQACWILRLGFVVLAVVAGIDKFFMALVDWTYYLAPWFADLIGVGNVPEFFYAVGVIEIIAGLGALFLPRVFGYIVAIWLAAIIINLLSYSGFYDIALRDFALMLGALALARLSAAYPRPGK